MSEKQEKKRRYNRKLDVYDKVFAFLIIFGLIVLLVEIVALVFG